MYKTYKVRPLQNYYWAGMTKLDSEKVYEATPATNLPYHEERGWVFVEGYVLAKEEYEMVKQ